MAMLLLAVGFPMEPSSIHLALRILCLLQTICQNYGTVGAEPLLVGTHLKKDTVRFEQAGSKFKTRPDQWLQLSTAEGAVYLHSVHRLVIGPAAGPPDSSRAQPRRRPRRKAEHRAASR